MGPQIPLLPLQCEGKVAGLYRFQPSAFYPLTTSDWILARPRKPMASSILTSSPYMELLFEFMLPASNQTAHSNSSHHSVRALYLKSTLKTLASAPAISSIIQPYTTVSTSKLLPNTSTGLTSLGAFTKVTGKPATYLDVSLDDYFNNYYPAGRKAVDRKIGTAVDKEDKTLQT